MRILIVEDERALCDAIARSLRNLAYSVDCCHDGQEALDLLGVEVFDLVVLDLNLPRIDGMTVLKALRKTDRETKVLILSARGKVFDKVTGLDAGANDYLTKPFSSKELLARIRALLRKKVGGDKLNESSYHIKDLYIFPDRHEVQVGTTIINLTKKEFELLTYLAKNKNIVLGRDRILEDVWGYDYVGDTNIVDVYIRYLRSKVDEVVGKKYIHTVRGIGYVARD